MRLIFNRWFNFTAGSILFITGAAKVWSAFGTARLLSYPDPIFDISFGHLMFGVGTIELIISVLCLSNKVPRLATTLVAYMATNFLIYRAGLGLTHWRRPCLCLGNLTDALHISPHAAGVGLDIALAYLLLGSFIALLAPWPESRERKSFEPLSVAKCGNIS